MNNGTPRNLTVYSGAIALAGLLLTQVIATAPAAAEPSPAMTSEPELFSATDRLGAAVFDSQTTPIDEKTPLMLAQPRTEVFQAAPFPSPPPAIEPPELPESPEAEARFGDRGDDRWYIQGAAATHIDNQENGQFGMVGAGISHFFVARHSINGELNSFYFSQNGDDAVGLNLAVLIRSHLVRQPNWSLYIDGGAGVLGSTDDVPSDGSPFNFTPQAGIGATVGLENNRRLMVGVRWHHISNANTFDDNPGRDSIMGYVGLNLPR